MKQILLITALTLCVTWAAAQNSPSSQSPSSSPSSTSQMGSKSSSGSSQTVQGCLSGSDGNFMLTDQSGTTYRLTGDTSKLSEHVGHEVKVTGSTSAGSAASGASAGSEAGSTSGASGGSQELQVSSVKHVAKSCTSGGPSK
jgi:hypothetical protein